MLYASTPRVSPALFLLIFATPSLIGGAQRKSTYIKTAQRAYTTVYVYVLVAFQIQKTSHRAAVLYPLRACERGFTRATALFLLLLY
jgi:hypothetical protein